jgi:hypothetical protein
VVRASVKAGLNISFDQDHLEQRRVKLSAEMLLFGDGAVKNLTAQQSVGRGAMIVTELKIMSVIRLLCLTPLIVVYGAWMLVKFTLGLIVLLLGAWLIHRVFGIEGDVMLALPVIYVLSYLLPNPRWRDSAKKLTFKGMPDSKLSVKPKTKFVDLKAYRRGVKQ